MLLAGVRVRQLRWKSADTNYDAGIVGAENVTKTPSSTFTFLAQKYELFYRFANNRVVTHTHTHTHIVYCRRHNPLYGPNRLGRCDFVVGTDEYGHKKINLYFRFKVIAPHLRRATFLYPCLLLQGDSLAYVVPSIPCTHHASLIFSIPNVIYMYVESCIGSGQVHTKDLQIGDQGL